MQVKVDSKEYIEFTGGDFHVRIDKSDGETIEAECWHIIVTPHFLMTEGVNFRIVPTDNLSELVIANASKTTSE